jgi:Plasmid pRiA4b ORF-3-like protein
MRACSFRWPCAGLRTRRHAPSPLRGWTNSHLFEIRVRDVGWGIPSPDWPDGPLDARKVQLIDVLEDAGTKTLRYLYDYGDGWEHTIKVERMSPADTNIAYPRLIEASGRCPPEDAGGPRGYDEMLEALADPDHERHAEIREWVGDDFDPHAFDAEPLRANVAALAKRWSRKPAAKKPRPLDPRASPEAYPEGAFGLASITLQPQASDDKSVFGAGSQRRLAS